MGPELVLYEVRTGTDREGADTIVTYVTPQRIRVSQDAGDAILDVPLDRLVFLDRRARTYRQMSLATWEAGIAAAADSARARRRAEADSGRADLGFEPAGPAGKIAGFDCERYHMFTRRELFPGEVEEVEQEVWVSAGGQLPEGAYRMYLRSLDALEGIGLAGPIHRPPGLVLYLETHTHPFGKKRGAGDQVERTEVVRIERRRIPDGIFEIPDGFIPADSSHAGP